MTTPPGPIPPSGAPATTCPRCGGTANSRFCAECGTPVAGARCAKCDTLLSSGARFCHRCGTPAASGPTPRAATPAATVVPWTIAAVALVALAISLAPRRGGGSPGGRDAAAPVAAAPATGAGRPPDLSELTPRDAADRLFDRVMRLQEEGKQDSVTFFAPMAVAAYSRLTPLDVDARFHLGAIGLASGDPGLVRMAGAQADTILSARPTHLLGLMLGAGASTAAGDAAASRRFNKRLIDAAPRELALPLDEYLQHRPVIDNALRTARATP